MNVKRRALLCVLLQAYYYSAIVEDVLLRFGWILTVTVTTLVTFDGISDIFATVLAPLEVFRYTKSLFFIHPFGFSHSSFLTLCLVSAGPRSGSDKVTETQ